ncbi:Lipoprotein [Acetobacteraceae bacterium EV16G]|uniref:Lipoprotein n=1 Tax=Sorlinia euscelidii TaxID=3081148 RepID=A0ABU7U5F9_9PROT
MSHAIKCRLAFASFIALTACSGGQGPSPSKDPRGRWSGALVTEQGQCPDGDNSLLQIEDKTIVFAPAGGSVLLRGERGKSNDVLNASFTHPDTNHKPYRMVFRGHPVGNAIGGIYATPTCRAHIVMTRTHA